jgi:hypothetical protein
MDYDSDKSSNRSSSVIEKELEEWPESINSDVLAARARGTQTRQNQNQRIKFWSQFKWAASALIVLIVLLVAVWWQFGRRREVNQPTLSATTTSPTPALPGPPATASELDQAKLKTGKSDDTEQIRKTESKVVSGDQEILSVVQYDFKYGTFIVNNTELKNQGGLTAIFRSLRDELKNGWVLIFATASVENTVKHNLELCERRLYAVRDLLKQDAALDPSGGYWGILAGEFKAEQTQGLPPKEEEKREEQLANELGESWLGPQRKLIVITIQPLRQLTPEAKARVPFVVAKKIYDESAENRLPHNYDASDNEPFVLKAGPIGNPTNTTSRSPSP